MQVSIEKISNVERRLTIVVPANQVEEAFAEQIDRFAKNANIKGFRPGKAPISHIKQRFGEDARKEALSSIIQKALYQAIQEQNLKPISTPRIEPKTILANQPLEFVASFEVLPDIEAIKLSIDQVEKLKVDIQQADVDHVVDQLLKQYTKWTLVDRPAVEKDRIVIDYYPIFEGKEEAEHKAENFPLELGSNRMLPGFEEGLIGVKPGEQRNLQLIFPTDFHIADKAGKPVEFVITVKQVFEAEMPEMDTDFVQKLGIKSGSVDDLKTQIRQSLEQERDRLVSEKLKEQVFRALLEQNPLDVPNSLVAQEAKNIHDEMYAHQHHDHSQHSHDEMSAFNEVAKKRVALGLLVAEYAKKANLSADKAKVRERIEMIASVYENPQEVVTWLSTDERRSGIEAQVLEDQVIDKLMEGVPVTEKTMSYAELKGTK